MKKTFAITMVLTTLLTFTHNTSCVSKPGLIARAHRQFRSSTPTQNSAEENTDNTNSDTTEENHSADTSSSSEEEALEEDAANHSDKATAKLPATEEMDDSQDVIDDEGISDKPTTSITSGIPLGSTHKASDLLYDIDLFSEDSDAPDDADPKSANRKKSDKENEMDDDNASDYIHLFSDDSEPDDTEYEPGIGEESDKENETDNDSDSDWLDYSSSKPVTKSAKASKSKQSSQTTSKSKSLPNKSKGTKRTYDDEFRDFEDIDDDFSDFDTDDSRSRVDIPQAKRARVEQPQLAAKDKKKKISKKASPNCIKVYPASTNPIDKSEINDDGANSRENISTIRKQMPDRTIIAVCPTDICISTIDTPTTYTSFNEAIKDKLSETLEKCKGEQPIIYFGSTVYFGQYSFKDQTIKADIIICGSGFTTHAFQNNIIDGMCILFHPDMNIASCFVQNTINKGLFIVGDGPYRDTVNKNFPISQSQNTCYIYGDNLMNATYKLQLPPNHKTDFPGILTFAIQTSKEFDMPRVAVYDPATCKYNSYDQKNLDVIRDKMKGRTIIAVCSPCKLDFDDVKTEIFEKYKKSLLSDPNKRPIIYFGQNMYFSVDSFKNQTIDSDIIFCGTKFGYRSFYKNSIKGMCIIFNPKVEIRQSVSQNTITNGLFVVGDGPVRDDKHQTFPICQFQNDFYLFGENLMDDSCKMPPPANVSKDFSDILDYVTLKSKEFETPLVTVYEPTYTYNAYDHENLKTIRTQLYDRPIIAVCPPCRLELSSVKKELFDLYKKLESKNPIIYFGSNVCFSLDSFKNQTMNADIIICGSIFSPRSFRDNKINGMCLLFHPTMNPNNVFCKNEVKKGLFVVGCGPSKNDDNFSFPIYQTQNVCYLFGTNLIHEYYKMLLPRNCQTDFSSILSYTIQKAKEFETPRIAEYDPTKYIYNKYDQENLEAIRKQMPDKFIIAVCSPCKIDFSPTSKKPFDLCAQLSALYKKNKFKNLLIYFGQNVYFAAEAFSKKTLDINEINADIIICGSKLVAKAFYDNTIKGMCMLFNPVAEAELCFYQNKISNGLFIAGNSDQKRIPIYSSCCQYTWYLFGEGLMSRTNLRPETIPTRDFSSALSFSLSKAQKISAALQMTAPITQPSTSKDDSISHSLPSATESQDMIDEEDSSTESKTADTTDTSNPNRIDQLADEIERLISKPNAAELKDLLSKHNVFRDNILDKEDLKAKLKDKSMDLAELTLIVLPLQMKSSFTNEEEAEDTSIAHPKQRDADLLSTDFCEDSSVDCSELNFFYPKKKKPRVGQYQISETTRKVSLYKEEDPSCVQVYLDTDPIDKGKIIDDGENSKENIIEIRKQMPGRIIIAVCPANPNTSFRDAIKKTFIAKLEAYKDKNPIIYFGKNIYFNQDSFTPKSHMLEITADIIIYRSGIYSESFHENKINGMFVIFEPETGKKQCFYNNTTSKGLFVVGDGPIRENVMGSYPICQSQNVCYLSGENLVDKPYKMQLPSPCSTSFSEILAYAIQKAKEFETPRVEKYDPARYTYTDYDKNNLSTIAEKMRDRTIIAVCSPCKTNFSDILPDFVSKYESYTNPIIYFGQNICFNSKSFIKQTLNADIIICGTKFSHKAFQCNTIEGMCVLFNPVMNSDAAFSKNTTSKGLFIAGNGRSDPDKPCYYPISQSKNVCYLFGENLIDPIYKMSLSFDVTTDTLEFADMLSDAIKKAKEFETPSVEKYDPRYTYNDYDKNNLSTIAEKMKGRTIIAVCSPCKLDFSDIQTEFIEKYQANLSSDLDKRPVIYFGQNIFFKPNSFTKQTINADIIICGSKLVSNSFKDNTVTGMCILFNPKVFVGQVCFSQHTIHKGLFVVGNALFGSGKSLATPIRQKQNACYLSGSNLMSEAYKLPFDDHSRDFQNLSDILSDDVLRPKEFDTPCISVYDPKAYTYNDYDKNNLSVIAKRMLGRTIIAVCSPCKLDFLDIKNEFIEKYNVYRSPDPDKKLIIYFGRNVYFSKDSFKNQTFDADIIVCGATFVNDSFQNTTITGMCILFNPVMTPSTQCFFKNTVHKDLFVVGNCSSSSQTRRCYPISIPKTQTAYYLSGENLMDYPCKILGICNVKKDFPETLDEAIKKSDTH